MLIRLLCAHEMTKFASKISRLNSKRLLRNLQKNISGLLYFAAPCILYAVWSTYVPAGCIFQYFQTAPQKRVGTPGRMLWTDPSTLSHTIKYVMWSAVLCNSQCHSLECRRSRVATFRLSDEQKKKKKKKNIFRQKQKQLQYKHNKQTQRRVSRRANAHRAGHP